MYSTRPTCDLAAMYLTSLVLFCSCASVAVSQERNTFYGRAQDATEPIGGSVRFRCKVKTLSINQGVAWMRSDRAGLVTEWLTSGTDVIATGPLAERLNVIGSVRSNLRFDLQIKDLRPSDEGLYICNVLTFGDPGIVAQTRSSGNVLRVVASLPSTGSPTTTEIITTTVIPITLTCSGIDPYRVVTVGDTVTIRCTKNIHRYTSEDDELSLSWEKNNRTIASRRFVPDNSIGRGELTPEVINLTVEFTFKVGGFDDGAVFVCRADDGGLISQACSLGPLSIPVPMEFILSGRSVVYVEEGDGIRLHCPRTAGNEDLKLYWSQTPFLTREQYVLNRETMYIYRIAVKDDRLRVSCSFSMTNRKKVIGEVVIRVTRNGYLVTTPRVASSPTTEEPAMTTLEELDDMIFSTEDKFDSDGFLGGSGAGFLEITHLVDQPDFTLQMETTKIPTAGIQTISMSEMSTTILTSTSPVLTTTKQPTTPPVLTTHENLITSRIIDPFGGFRFPSAEPDWVGESTPRPTTLGRSMSESSADVYPPVVATVLLAVLVSTPGVILVVVLFCVVFMVCLPRNRLTKTWSVKSRPSVPEIHGDIESIRTSNKPTKASRQRNTAAQVRPPVPQIEIDESPPAANGTHYYEPMQWETVNGQPSRFERDNTKLHTFGHYATPFIHTETE